MMQAPQIGPPTAPNNSASDPVRPGAPRPRWSAVGRTPPTLILVGLALFLAILACPLVHAEAMLVRTMLGVAGVLGVWLAVLWARARATGHPLRVEFVPVRSHYVQGMVQTIILSYWGWYVRDVQLESPLIIAQVLYLTMLDALLSWSRGRGWRLGFGAMPIVLSTNLLLWFHHDVYYLQFVMITIGALGKQFVTWERDGRRTHIFNPSVFGQFTVAMALILTGTSNDLTRGQWIASTFEAPHYMILVIFLLGLGVQSLFGVTLMTLAAAGTLWVLNLVYTEITGLYFFVTVNIAATIFLGLHLLITDPATTPRTNLGKLVFGALYGLGYFILFRVLDLLEVPVFWDKLLPVPILNLLAPALDRMARAGAIGRFNERWQSILKPKWMNVVHMTVWAAIFSTMLLMGFLGFGTDHHPGSSVMFWKRAYADGRQHAGHSLVMAAGARAEGMGDPDALNELGVICVEGMGDIVEPNRAKAADYFARAAERGSIHGANNVVAQRVFLGEAASNEIVTLALSMLDAECKQERNPLGCYLIGVALEFGRAGLEQDHFLAAAYYTVAGKNNVFSAKGLARLVLSGHTEAEIDTRSMSIVLGDAADGGDAEACWYLAHLLHSGTGVRPDEVRAREYLDKACALGLEEACIPADAPFPEYRVPTHMARPAWSTAYPID